MRQATSSVSRERSRSHEPGRDQTTATSRGGGKPAPREVLALDWHLFSGVGGRRGPGRPQSRRSAILVAAGQPVCFH